MPSLSSSASENGGSFAVAGPTDFCAAFQ
jgi:hypothetical protein